MIQESTQGVTRDAPNEYLSALDQKMLQESNLTY